MHGCATETTVRACIEQLIRLENNRFAALTAQAVERWQTSRNA